MIRRLFSTPLILLFVISTLVSFYVGITVPPTWTAEKITLDVAEDEEGILCFKCEGKDHYILRKDLFAWDNAELNPTNLHRLNAEGKSPQNKREYVYETAADGQTVYSLLIVQKHWKLWSLLPAVVALSLCWITKEPVSSLFSGIIAGALLLGEYDVMDNIIVRQIATPSAAGIIVLYLWLLGGLMGIWSRTGASKAFAELMTKHFVRGPRSAKLVTWFLGVIFFQGGTISTVLVGTTVRPFADKNRVSHEELAYIVDSTASPIASQLAFNAWPGYVQAFIFVAGVPWLATEADRITFFFKSVPFCFYAIFAVLGTFLLSIERAPFLGRKLRNAMIRARTTNKLNAPDAEPLNAEELFSVEVPEGYTPNAWEFIGPLVLLIFIAISTFIVTGTPNVRWAFGIALFVAFTTALLKGMALHDVIEGIATGLKGVVLGSMILLLAIIIGTISKETGGGLYLVELLKESIPYWSLPLLLLVMTTITAFSTGTSWGTYAIVFPLAMPLSWAIANSQNVSHPQFFMTLCFAAVMDGSVFGDQCSPISDTTVLSSMSTGCDLMDHVKTQLPQASAAVLLAAICWTAITFLFA